MLDKSQSQSVDPGAVAIQAGGDVNITKVGLSYSEVRDVALDVFRSTFYQLAGVAADTASQRAKEITEDFLSKLEKENPAGLEKANDPDFQYALFTAQREYARCGDKELEALLVDLLVDRSKQDQRNILQIVLNESLNTAPKLTEGQLAVLALIFLFKYTQNFGVGNHASFGAYLDAHASPFIPKMSVGPAGFQHMEFTGCGSPNMMGRSLESILGEVYQGQFLKGFDHVELDNRQLSIGADQNFFIPCLNDQTKLQVRANSRELLTKNLDVLAVLKPDRSKIIELFNLNKMSDPEIREKCIQLRAYMRDLFENWEKSPIQTSSLTSVGIAIAHANIKRLVGEFANLSIWIN